MADRRSTAPWPEVVSFYQGLAAESASPHAPMTALVQFLAASRYARSLFPCTSHEALVIGREPNFEAGSGELQIRFDAKLQVFSFTHLQRADDPDPWTRECAADAWRQVLERILHKRLQWFHEG